MAGAPVGTQVVGSFEGGSLCLGCTPVEFKGDSHKICLNEDTEIPQGHLANLVLAKEQEGSSRVHFLLRRL